MLSGLTLAVMPAQAAVMSGLPQGFSPVAMFATADGVVRGVICVLLLASVATWTVLIAKSFEMSHAIRCQRRAFAVLDDAHTLKLAVAHLDRDAVFATRLLDAAVTEMQLSAEIYEDRDGVKERIALRLERIEAAAGRQMFKGIGMLATIGATAPFVGLFGTVWGVMNSFVGIATAQTSNLSVVAPGIAEALLATAVGLVAAIPAVIIYNLFVRCIASYKALVADCASVVLRLASRDLSGLVRRAEPSLRAVAE
ncbi:MAG: tonB-system energizer ExbB [Rhizomicrobium sp.]